MNETLLDIDGLSHGFGAAALWRIERLRWSGEDMVHLQGDNGSGKTTLLRILAGLDAPRRGRVRWHLEVTPRRPPCPGQVIYLHQSPYMFDISVARNLQLAAHWQGLERPEAQRLVSEMLAWCGLEAQQRQSARALSGGERLRLALARAWLLTPRALLLDEPTANLDARAITEVDALVADLAANGCAVLLSAHHPSALTRRCRRCWQLRDGLLEESVVGARETAATLR